MERIPQWPAADSRGGPGMDYESNRCMTCDSRYCGAVCGERPGNMYLSGQGWVSVPEKIDAMVYMEKVCPICRRLCRVLVRLDEFRTYQEDPRAEVAFPHMGADAWYSIERGWHPTCVPTAEEA